ncbi:glucosyl transferase [Streptomyces sp. JS01]|uniref:glycosyltransferase family 2 protein n=1 Tax=unclassified Streptomyces TaxID=2593676 RepID=UPI00050771EA|nr:MULTISPECIES: glucosyl transferase [unclassified Streptomyces]KFK88298.1 glucosyl transferase [Streptomyces sp. JS01]MBK3552625.1 glycosyltransferase family 2 protein [Streptomyces sp. MBT61]
MHPVHLAVLMTSHDRRARTLSALRALEEQRGLPAWTTLGVHLVDTGSTDGTPEAVRRCHPAVEVMSVGADVSRNQALRIASRNSRSGGGGGGPLGGTPGGPSHAWTHQLWLDDGVELFRDSLATLLRTSEAAGSDAVVVGAVRNAYGDTVYSGRRGRSLTLVEPGAHRPERCDTYDGRVVLVPRAVYDLVGDPDKVFRHRMGDYDHGRRARRAGVAAFVAPGHAGECVDGPAAPGSREPGIGVREALRRVTSVRELPPRQWWVYCLRHTWPWAPYLMVSPYARTAARATVGRLRG